MGAEAQNCYPCKLTCLAPMCSALPAPNHAIHTLMTGEHNAAEIRPNDPESRKWSLLAQNATTLIYSATRKVYTPCHPAMPMSCMPTMPVHKHSPNQLYITLQCTRCVEHPLGGVSSAMQPPESPGVMLGWCTPPLLQTSGVTPHHFPLLEPQYTRHASNNPMLALLWGARSFVQARPQLAPGWEMQRSCWPGVLAPHDEVPGRSQHHTQTLQV